MESPDRVGFLKLRPPDSQNAQETKSSLDRKPKPRRILKTDTLGSARRRKTEDPASGGSPASAGFCRAPVATILLAMIAQRYRIGSVPGHTVEHEVRLTVRPRQTMLMQLRRV